MDKKFPRVLVISHNMFGSCVNMGKTLNAMFRGWDIDCIAQLCFQSEKDAGDVCRNYYRMTDTDVLKSIVKRNKCGRIINVEEERDTLTTGRGDNKLLNRVYRYGVKRTPSAYFIRPILWKFGKWHTKALDEWIDAFDPEVIFFVSGDYSFAYDIAYEIATSRNVPMVTYCCDDHYLKQPKNGFLAKHNKKRLMKSALKVLDYSSSVATICEKMSRDYKNAFNVDTFALYTNTDLKRSEKEKENRIVYIGNLCFNRYKELIEAGRALKRLDCENKPDFIDVYSLDNDPEFLKELTPENGVRFNGALSYSQITQMLQSSKALLHVEYFSDDSKQFVYSITTKIPDSLASGTPVLAIGPADVGTIEYLKENDAAFVATERNEVADVMKRLFEDEEECRRITENAMRLAEKNHNTEKNLELLRRKLSEAAENKR